ncbi:MULTISPECIES: DUF2291 domain-containing protein [Pseudothermotoga]|uniref:Periplasmic lipoprotein n=1 Tax=Pseudothermotoga lettingae (strain ATCC BAA-301 / DSM 14385 / NBRC 107922 / TMO) TaxID=416591 RepID=A8F6U9_PSELT|nr:MULTISPECIES: DUF2291 domain-containing protein [Pseudothermotoga]ABV33883.1 conserved hypothetical protein [Pseudothermotoga lettingae TMO]MDK2884286.1 hypothetical protein [Pseudothermotoga sp.]GLI49180.1 hypothetical protein PLETTINGATMO_13490 [Pseudothermotoga lettingae TMO]
MRKKIILSVIAVIAIILISKSCKIIPLDEIKKEFDPENYAQSVWLELQGQLTNLSKANSYDVLELLDLNPEQAHQKYGKVVGISNYRYYIVEGTGRIISVNDDGVLVKIREDAEQPELYITRRVFGNIIVMATGIIKMEDFDRIMDFNLVSTALNDIVSDEVATPFIEMAKEKSVTSGLMIKFIGLFNLLKDDPVKYPITVIPLRLELSQGGY